MAWMTVGLRLADLTGRPPYLRRIRTGLCRHVPRLLGLALARAARARAEDARAPAPYRHNRCLARRGGGGRKRPGSRWRSGLEIQADGTGGRSRTDACHSPAL